MNKTWKWGDEQDTRRTWNIYTSIYIFKGCVRNWINCLYPHLNGYENVSDNVRELFFFFLNYGNTIEYYQ